MKKFHIIAIVALLSVPMFAQQPRDGGRYRQKGEWSEKMKAEKVEFITSFVGLTEEEAQAFWPLYNEAQAEVRSKHEAEREAYKALVRAVAENAPASEIDMLSRVYVEIRSHAVNLESYYERSLKVLPPEKAAKVILSEETFRRQQISRLREQGGYRQGGPRPGGFEDRGEAPSAKAD